MRITNKTSDEDMKKFLSKYCSEDDKGILVLDTNIVCHIDKMDPDDFYFWDDPEIFRSTSIDDAVKCIKALLKKHEYVSFNEREMDYARDINSKLDFSQGDYLLDSENMHGTFNIILKMLNNIGFKGIEFILAKDLGHSINEDIQLQYGDNEAFYFWKGTASELFKDMLFTCISELSHSYTFLHSSYSRLDPLARKGDAPSYTEKEIEKIAETCFLSSMRNFDYTKGKSKRNLFDDLNKVISLLDISDDEQISLRKKADILAVQHAYDTAIRYHGLDKEFYSYNQQMLQKAYDENRISAREYCTLKQWIRLTGQGYGCVFGKDGVSVGAYEKSNKTFRSVYDYRGSEIESSSSYAQLEHVIRETDKDVFHTFDFSEKAFQNDMEDIEKQFGEEIPLSVKVFLEKEGLHAIPDLKNSDDVLVVRHLEQSGYAYAFKKHDTPNVIRYDIMKINGKNKSVDDLEIKYYRNEPVRNISEFVRNEMQKEGFDIKTEHIGNRYKHTVSYEGDKIGFIETKSETFQTDKFFRGFEKKKCWDTIHDLGIVDKLGYMAGYMEGAGYMNREYNLDRTKPRPSKSEIPF